MDFQKWLESFTYAGQCDRLRKCGHEQEWQALVQNAVPVSREEFVSNCDLTPLLDDGEAVEEYLDKYTDAKFYKSKWGNKEAYFLGTRGFEFIFVANGV